MARRSGSTFSRRSSARSAPRLATSRTRSPTSRTRSFASSVHSSIVSRGVFVATFQVAAKLLAGLWSEQKARQGSGPQSNQEERNRGADVAAVVGRLIPSNSHDEDLNFSAQNVRAYLQELRGTPASLILVQLDGTGEANTRIRSRATAHLRCDRVREGFLSGARQCKITL